MVLLWVESQSTAVIALVMFAGCYALAAIIHFAVGRFSHSALAAELKATTPVMLTPLAVLLGLLIAFLAQRVWTNVDHANAYIAAETSALRETVLLADALPPATGDPLRDMIRKHVNFIVLEDWQSMADTNVASRKLPELLAQAKMHILSFTPVTHGHEIAQQRVVVALQEAIEARLDRILLSESAISPLQWYVILILASLIFLTICMVHLDRPFTSLVNLFVFSSAVATCLVLITVNDRPFATGGITLKPTAFEELSRDLD